MSRRILPAAAAALALGACASTPTKLYTLDPVAPAAPLQPARAVPPVRVDAVHIPPNLDRPEIVQETGANRIVLHDFAEWSAPLGAQMRRTLTQDLAARLPLGAVTYPDAPKPPLGRGIVVDILALGHDGANATMDVSWTLTVAPRAPAAGPLGGAPSPIAYTGRTLRVTAPSAGGGPASVPADISALLGRLSDSIAADLSR
ncbi:MAG: membrane integrity-associated transporter subunit PqiC [Caulobacteraceae bacterium]|nr:membrane integrity-associated transporter subunit PqiC [Caulobacter sp.]